MNKQHFIGEIKTCSPYGFKSKYNFDFLLNLAVENCDEISIHTEAQFEGSFNLLERVADKYNIPILAKGWHKKDSDVQRAFDSGASSVLVVGRKPPYEKYGISNLLFEPTSFDNYIDSYWCYNNPVVWNFRDLKTGKRKRTHFSSIIKIHTGILYQASYIKKPDDIYRRSDGFIVGENLVDFINKYKLLNK